MVNICKYCKQELKQWTIYNTCFNRNCYFYGVLFIPRPDEKDEPVKPKSRMQNVKNTAIGIFKDIKTEMGKTMNDTGEALRENMNVVNSPKSKNLDKRKDESSEDVFDTPFGRFDAGGL